MVYSYFLAASLVATASASHPTTDVYYHEKTVLGPGMWTFGPKGIFIHSVDGKEVLHTVPNTLFCPTSYNYMTGQDSDDCSFFDVTSDGKKHVWAAAHSGVHRVEAFEIDTGDLVAAIPTCSTPLDLDYHPSREEMWLHCAGTTTGQEGHIDVFSTNSLSVNYEQVHLNLTDRVYGRSVFHSSLGNYGYASVYKVPILYKIDLSTKLVVEMFDIPLSTGSYEMAYSALNKHIYLRTRVCCSCGTPESDIESCGRMGAEIVDVVTGPNKGFTGNGTCSNACEGSAADIGVYEFDTMSSTFLGTHNNDPKFGFGADPVASPDGKYIALLGNDGGQNVRVLKPGMNGELSSVAFDIPVNFSDGDGGVVISDAVFIENDVHGEIAIFASSKDNDIALVDLTRNPPLIQKLTLTEAQESTGGRARKIEWAPDTNFVWVTGTDSDEMYVVELSGDGDITKAKVSTTLIEVPSSHLIYVENYERKRTVEMLSQNQKSMVENSVAPGNGLAVASLVLSILSVVIALVVFVKFRGIENGRMSAGDVEGHPEDMKSLGSKITS